LCCPSLKISHSAQRPIYLGYGGRVQLQNRDALAETDYADADVLG
jgi:hypothetical protein